MSKSLPILAVLMGLAACTQFPEIDALPAGSAQTAPQLVTIESLIAQVGSPSIDRATPLAARAARLRARAALMRGPIFDPATRERLGTAMAIN